MESTFRLLVHHPLEEMYWGEVEKKYVLLPAGRRIQFCLLLSSLCVYQIHFLNISLEYVWKCHRGHGFVYLGQLINYISDLYSWLYHLPWYIRFHLTVCSIRALVKPSIGELVFIGLTNCWIKIVDFPMFILQLLAGLVTTRLHDTRLPTSLK